MGLVNHRPFSIGLSAPSLLDNPLERALETFPITSHAVGVA